MDKWENLSPIILLHFQFGIPTCLSGKYVLGRQWWLSSGQLSYYAHPGFIRIHYASGHYNMPTQIYITIDAPAVNIMLTIVSASRKTHLVYWTKRQQCNLVKVTPNSGLSIKDKLTLSLLSSRETSTTSSKALLSWDFIGGLRGHSYDTYALFLLTTAFSRFFWYFFHL